MTRLLIYMRWWLREGHLLKDIRMEAMIRAAHGQKYGWLVRWAQDIEGRKP